MTPIFRHACFRSRALALLLLVALGAAATPARADHDDAPARGGKRWTTNSSPNHACGYAAAGHGETCGAGGHVSSMHRAFDRGYELGLREGRLEGYRDARWWHGWNPTPTRCLLDRRPAFREGYLAGFEDGYVRAYRSTCAPRHRAGRAGRRGWHRW